MTSNKLLQTSGGIHPVVSELVEYVEELYAHLAPVTPVDLSAPPSPFVDQEYRSIQVVQYDEKWFIPLVEMYDTFDSMQRTLGLPPITERVIDDWLEEVLDGLSIIAIHEDSVVGHVMFVADGAGAYELAVFVHQDYQRAGIGTQLLKAGFGYAKEAGMSDV